MDWKRLAVAANYYSTLPWRQWMNRQADRRGTAPVIVLFYHRVADTHPNDWTIPCDMFARQIDWLQRHCELISLDECRRRIQGGHNHRLSVSITFDDGYADNCKYALPLLVERGVPCTYFVSFQNVCRSLPFPHDVLRGVPLAPNTIDDLSRIARQGIEVGAHTRTHADLGRVREPWVLHDEIVDAGRELAQAVGQPVRFFAFPYGQPQNMPNEAFQVAHDAGYQAVCSAYGGYNFPGEDAFHLQRIHADPEMTRFRNWLTVDPRKLSLVRRHQYDLSPAGSPLAEALDVRCVR